MTLAIQSVHVAHPYVNRRSYILLQKGRNLLEGFGRRTPEALLVIIEYMVSFVRVWLLSQELVDGC